MWIKSRSMAGICTPLPYRTLHCCPHFGQPFQFVDGGGDIQRKTPHGRPVRELVVPSGIGRRAFTPRDEAHDLPLEEPVLAIGELPGKTRHPEGRQPAALTEAAARARVTSTSAGLREPALRLTEKKADGLTARWLASCLANSTAVF